MYRTKPDQYTDKDVQFVRNGSYGLAGGRSIVEKATDDEIKYILALNDRSAKLHNKHLDVNNQLDNFQKVISKR